MSKKKIPLKSNKLSAEQLWTEKDDDKLDFDGMIDNYGCIGKAIENKKSKTGNSCGLKGVKSLSGREPNKAISYLQTKTKPAVSAALNSKFSFSRNNQPLVSSKQVKNSNHPGNKSAKPSKQSKPTYPPLNMSNASKVHTNQQSTAGAKHLQQISQEKKQMNQKYQSNQRQKRFSKGHLQVSAAVTAASVKKERASSSSFSSSRIMKKTPALTKQQQHQKQLLQSGTNLSNALTIDDSSDEELMKKSTSDLSNSAFLFFGLHQFGKCAIRWPTFVEEEVVQSEKKSKASKKTESTPAIKSPCVVIERSNSNKFLLGIDEIVSIVFRDSISMNGFGNEKDVSAVYIKTKDHGPFHKMMKNSVDEDLSNPKSDGVLILFESSKGSSSKMIYDLFLKHKEFAIQTQKATKSLSALYLNLVTFDETESHDDLSNAIHQINDPDNFSGLETSNTPRRSLRSASKGPNSSAQVLLQYPPGKDAVDPVLISVGDKNRLTPYEYLNDNLVDFYLKYLVLERKVVPDRPTNRICLSKRKVSIGENEQPNRKKTKQSVFSIDSEEDEDDEARKENIDKKSDGEEDVARRETDPSKELITEEKLSQVHIFSSHFYGQLSDSTNFGGRRSSSKEKPANHAKVKKWTKDFDIFSKRMVFVPIVEYSHWSLAVICNLDTLWDYWNTFIYEPPVEEEVLVDEAEDEEDEELVEERHVQDVSNGSNTSSPRSEVHCKMEQSPGKKDAFDFMNEEMNGGSINDSDSDDNMCSLFSKKRNRLKNVKRVCLPESKSEGSNSEEDITCREVLEVDSSVSPQKEDIDIVNLEDEDDEQDDEVEVVNNQSKMEQEEEDLEPPCAPVTECLERVPCIVFMDSLKMHSPHTVSAAIRSYLKQEWTLKKTSTAQQQTQNSAKAEEGSSSSGGGGGDTAAVSTTKSSVLEDGKKKSSMVPEDVPEEILNEFNEFVLSYFSEKDPSCKLPIIQPKVPIQPNGFDCGVYALQYAEEMLCRWPSIDMDNVCSKEVPTFSARMFSFSHIEKKRSGMLKVIEGKIKEASKK